MSLKSEDTSLSSTPYTETRELPVRIPVLIYGKSPKICFKTIDFAKFVQIWSKAVTNVCSNCCLLAQEIIVVVAAAAVVAKVNEHFPPFPPQLAAKPKPAPLPPL